MTTPMMPAQQNFQQNMATMQPAGPMAGGGVNQPLANPTADPTQGAANPMSRQVSPDWQQTVNAGMQGGGQPGSYKQGGVANNMQTWLPGAGLGRDPSGGMTWHGNAVDYAKGRNNYLSAPQGWRGDNPGVVTPEQMAAIQGRVGDLRSQMKNYQQGIRGDNPRYQQRGMGLLQNRMDSLQAYKRFMGQHTAAQTPEVPQGPVDPVTGLPVDPNQPGGVASNFGGGLTNAGNLMALLAGQGMGTM
jgi:hypothetical protein